MGLFTPTIVISVWWFGQAAARGILHTALPALYTTHGAFYFHLPRQTLVTTVH